MPEWCMVYKNWATGLTGYPTVIDCKPSGEEPRKAINELYLLLHEYNPGDLPEPVHLPPELIGQRYLVYKALGGGRRDPAYELRSVYDRRRDRVIWMGGVYKHIIPGSPSKPPRQPSLPGHDGRVDPPTAPKGQKMIRKPVVYSAEGPFPEPRDEWLTLGVFDERMPTPKTRINLSNGGREIEADFHCVTGWSVGGLKWRGAPLLELLEAHGLRGKWLLMTGHGGYSTIIPYDETILDNAFIVTHMGDEILPREHGGPYRVLIPRLFGWKSIKWLKSILVGDTYIDGFWEARGYHWRGLVALDERFKTY